MFMAFLYIVLVLSVLALLGATVAAYVRVRRQLRRQRACDHALRDFLQSLEHDHEINRELTFK